MRRKNVTYYSKTKCSTSFFSRAHVTLRFGSGNKANLSFFTRENDFNKFDIFMSFRRLTINKQFFDYMKEIDKALT